MPQSYEQEAAIYHERGTNKYAVGSFVPRGCGLWRDLKGEIKWVVIVFGTVVESGQGEVQTESLMMALGVFQAIVWEYCLRL